MRAITPPCLHCLIKTYLGKHHLLLRQGLTTRSEASCLLLPVGTRIVNCWRLGSRRGDPTRLPSPPPIFSLTAPRDESLLHSGAFKRHPSLHICIGVCLSLYQNVCFLL